MQNDCQFRQASWRNLTKTLLVMKLTFLLLTAAFLNVYANTAAQKVTLSGKDIPLQKVFKVIKHQTSYVVFTSVSILAGTRPVTLSVNNMPLADFLEIVFKDQHINYQIEGKTILLSKKTTEKLPTEAIRPTELFVTPPPPLIDITGRILDKNGAAISGASILIKGTQKGVTSDDKGNFSLKVTDKNVVLVISFVGYKTQEIALNGRVEINVELEPEVKALEDVVIVGYGQEKKINLTGSVVTLGAKQIENRGVTNITNIMAGQAPGVTVLQRGGSPGRDGGSINIQGVGTLGTSTPLIIIDGVKSNDYTQINPNDIESISILKDAASSAIYGIDAANGVILITTKRGAKGKIKVDYDFQYGGSAIVGLLQKVNSADLATLYDEAQTNDGTPASGLKFSATDIQQFKDGSNPLNHPNTDWLKAIFNQPGTWSSHNLAISGGTDDTKYNVSFGYLDQGGIMESTGYKRYNFRTNFDQKLSERLNTGFNLALSQRNVIDPATVLGVGGETWYLHEAFQAWATDPITTSNGSYAYPLYSGLNSNSVAYASSANGYSNNNDTRLVGTAFAEFKIIDGLSLKGIAATTRDYNYASDVGLGVDLFTINSATGVPSTTPNNTSASMPAIPTTTSVYRGFYRNVDNDYQLLLNYDKTFGKSQIKGLLGYESRNITDEAEDITRENLSDPSLTQINAADPTNQLTDGNTIQYKSESVFSRLNYIYDNKYLFEADARQDASSRFAAGHRDAIFPSISAGWIISKEDFFKIPIISSLKLRASYGVLGNEQINDYQYLSTYVLGSSYIFNGIRTTGINEGPLANSIITWEKTTVKNFGIDVAFLNNRLSFTGDYYIRDTRNILLNLSQPAILGAAPPVANAGAVRNQGFDLIIGYKDKVGQFGYYVNANFNCVNNKITDLDGTQYPGRELGDPIYNIYGYVAQGIFQNQAQINVHADQTALGGTPKPGDIIYKDLNGDGKINASDQVNLGSYFPKITYGLSFGANYKGFDISTVWSGVADVMASIAGSRLAQPFGDFGSSPITAQLNSWTPTNTNAAYPRTSLSSTYNYVQNSFWVRNTSYLKLRNAQLGYILPASITQHLKISRMRVYLSGENLLTLSPFKLMDPESITTGDPFFGYSGTTAYPTTKRYLAGISVTF
jgi:TonB-linked SusC/RagA family outer membrane protein